MNDSAIDTLRGDLAGVRRDKFRDGDVIRWVSGEKYTYAAIKAGGKWWLTGTANYYGSAVFDYDDLVRRVLRRSEVSKVEVSTAWTAVED